MRNRWTGPLLAGALAAGTLAACAADADDGAPTVTPTVTPTVARATTEPTTDPTAAPGEQQSPATDLVRLADAVVAYALGEASTFPHAPTIALSVGGEPARTIEGSGDRDGWRTCPAGWEGYAAATCPVDLLGPIMAAAVNDARIVHSTEIGEVTCAPERTAPPPPGRRIVLRLEPRRRSCATDFAIVLTADGRGRLTAVDLTLSNP